MNIEDYPNGGTMHFESDPDAEVQMEFRPAAISKTDARRIGLTFCETDDAGREAMLAVCGPTMIRRSLLVFANLAARMGEPDTATYAHDLRKVVA